MKIAMLIYHYFPYGGQQRDFMKILKRCLLAGHTVQVYCLKWQGDIPAGVDVVFVPVSALASHVKYKRFTEWVTVALRQDPADVVIGFSKMPGLDVYFAADPCFAERMHRERRFFTQYLPRYRHFMQFEKAVFADNSGTKVLLLSPQQQDDFGNHYPGCSARLQRLSPGLDQDRLPPANKTDVRQQFRDEFGISDDEFIVLQVGSGFRVKGLDRSIKAFASLPYSLRNKTHLFIVGQDKPGKYAKLAGRLRLAGRCHFLGGRDDVPRFLLGCDLLLHPAYSESAGYTLLEAIINGLPVLTTDTCGYAFHVNNAGAGQVCRSPFKQKDLNARLHEMLISSDRRRWQSNGLAYAEKIDVFGMADEALAAIERVWQEKKSAATERVA